VVKFCEKKEIGLTRAMIQNYIRHGLVPPPLNKRVYTHKHLAALVLIGFLKTVFDMDTVKAALCPLMDEEGLSLADYAAIIKKWTEITDHWKSHMPKILKDETPKDITRLALMIHAMDVKELAGG
jgi:DNA-binding transcriptional MerR regulator